MKKILIGFIAIGLLTFVGCEKDYDTDTETTDITDSGTGDESTDTSGDDADTETTDITDSDTGVDGSTDSDTDTETTDTSSDDGGTDEYTYKTVIIGEQEWFAENLKTSKYNDGTVIPNITDDAAWSNLSTGAWCNYDNSSSNDPTYGKLYNWYAVETGKLCPTGWHVPTDSEWTVLTDYITANGHDGTEGTVLKAISGWDVLWSGRSGNGTDDYGWLGLPCAGRSGYGGAFHDVGYFGYWWSSSQDGTRAWCRSLGSSSDFVGRYEFYKGSGHSVRCIRD